MKYRVGDLVKTKRGVRPKIEGIVLEIIQPTTDVQLLWASDEPHYLVKDSKNDEFLSVIERGLERK
jgi:hypothetical protein